MRGERPRLSGRLILEAARRDGYEGEDPVEALSFLFSVWLDSRLVEGAIFGPLSGLERKKAHERLRKWARRHGVGDRLEDSRIAYRLAHAFEPPRPPREALKALLEECGALEAVATYLRLSLPALSRWIRRAFGRPYKALVEEGLLPRPQPRPRGAVIGLKAKAFVTGRKEWGIWPQFEKGKVYRFDQYPALQKAWEKGLLPRRFFKAVREGDLEK